MQTVLFFHLDPDSFASIDVDRPGGGAGLRMPRADQ